MPTPVNITYFPNAAALRKWFARHHATAADLWIGFYKRETGKPSVTWPESVDEALCVGWIDGIRKRIDDERYTIRFTRRRPKSIWSAVNIRRMADLAGAKRIRPAGRKAFEARTENRSGVYAYEQRRDHLDEPYAGLLKKNSAAWAFFERLPPSHRKTLCWWIVSAKREETRLARLKKLIEASRKGQRLF
jgi:uncharacterized protein YdeI (YjbR/CyaY-like superfamily)